MMVENSSVWKKEVEETVWLERYRTSEASGLVVGLAHRLTVITGIAAK